MAQLPSPVLETGVGDRSLLTICPLCKASASRTECFARDELLDRGGCQYQYVRCISCDLVYLSPIPSGDVYPSDYPAWSRNKGRLFSRHFLIDLPQRRLVRRFKKWGSLLDVGCGMGTFLACLKKEGGWRVEGVEPSSFGCALARETYGLHLQKGNLQNVSLEKNSFDVVTMWDVLEHVPDPRETLKAVFNLLKEDGVFLFSMPNIGSLDYAIFKRRWFFLTAPYHFCLFSTQGAIRLLQEEGFTVLWRRTTLLSFYEAVFFSLQLVIRRGECFAETLLQKAQKKFLSLFGLALAILTCLVCTPLFLIAHGFQKGSRMVVAARKS